MPLSYTIKYTRHGLTVDFEAENQPDVTGDC